MAHQKQQKIKTRSQAVARIDRTASHHILIPHTPFPIGDPLERSLYLQPFSRYYAPSVLGHEFDLSVSRDIIRDMAI